MSTLDSHIKSVASSSLATTPSDWTEYNQTLLELLVAQQGMDPDALQTICKAKPYQPLERELIQQGKLTIQDVGQLLAQHTNHKYLSLAEGLNHTQPSDLYTHLPADFCQKKQLLPVTIKNGHLLIATISPNKAGLKDEITYLSGYQAELHVTTGLELYDYWLAQQQELHNQSLTIQKSEVTFTNLIDAILEQAILQEASDIHIEPKGDKATIRFRLDGVLRTHQQLELDKLAGLVARIKVLANMDIAEHRQPQDGQFNQFFQDSRVFFRVNSFPLSSQKEKVSIRLLRPHQELMAYDHLGMTREDIQLVEELLRQPFGIILACGPTGSGKSTSIYTLLESLNTTENNITTIEDPIELEMAGINQTEVNPKANRTLERCLQAVLRQDPDVVMIGEIRDSHTLQQTLQAALTGHLMLSTFHANSAASAITRMIDMGISPQLLSSGLAGIVAQRLVRQLCNHCKTPKEATPAEKRQLFPQHHQRQLDELTLYHPVGCTLCQHTGYKGRTGVFEIMPLDRELRYLISEGANEFHIEDAAIANGMTSLSINGRLKVINGLTTLDEMIRVIGEW